MKFEARIHGVDVKDEEEEKKKPENIMRFGDPEEYKKMPMKERKELTAKMKGHHQLNLHIGK